VFIVEPFLIWVYFFYRGRGRGGGGGGGGCGCGGVKKVACELLQCTLYLHLELTFARVEFNTNVLFFSYELL